MVPSRLAVRWWTLALSIALLPNNIAAQQLSSSLEQFAQSALQQENAAGLIHVRDVISGRVLAHVSAPTEEPDATLGIDSSIRPLSLIKVYLTVAWLEEGLGATVVTCAPSSTKPLRHMLFEDVLVSGCDSAAKQMAQILRSKRGSATVLSDLRRYGIEGLTLPSDAGDADWARVLSLGEEKVPVTPRQLSAFFSAIGQHGGKLFSPETALKLKGALEAVVQRGTATSVKDTLTDTDWRIGGKTGTGPGECGDHCDGWFASLLSDPQQARYVILVFVRGRGLGGGLAARTAASVARYLVLQSQRDASQAADSRALPRDYLNNGPSMPR